MTTLGLLAWIAAVAAEAPAPVPASSAPAPVPASSAPAYARPAPASPAPLAVPSNRFRLALTYTHVLYEDGALGNDSLTTQALGLHWTFASSTYVRNHFEIGEQWESAGGYSARGLRIDLISFGYPIHLVEGEVQFSLEPIITPVRGEIMFPSGAKTFLRMEGGVGLELLVASRGWYAGIEPVHIDFRYWVYSSAQSRTGFTQVFPLRVSVGHEF
ncbi:MAG: hypothetical protein JWM82_3192 [Myxococcales bacterium]|nr:hypothetical protein [Myxococcales bacterium]